MSRDPYWNHNTRYHPWLLGQVPTRARTALDVGCGDGLLARKLSTRCDSVLGVDLDPAILTTADKTPNIRYERADFRTVRGTFDFVAAVASLHHVPLTEGLCASRRLVAPGGTLAVVGLSKLTLRTDWGQLALWPAVLAVDLWPPRPSGPPAMIVRDSADTLAEIRRAAASALPGARIRRRLMWRYTLSWTRPAN
ncbi:trans-aconitate 2-methyltransferase [Nocardia sp. XZ_19_385]|uniref:class I SAM-dependent methyltransferase n=1 Tax=Nocardia sp. XZ_19_385 TaxID=2769488 RepID=UPI00189098FB|nr:class I SAM-dependent methyltransferase [Nocardia sp. XZ_19_385]